MSAHDDDLGTGLQVFFDANDICGMWKSFCLIFLLSSGVEDANLFTEFSSGSLKELEVALDGVHSDDEMVRLSVGPDVLQTDECFPFLWLPNDGAQVLEFLT